MTLSDLDLEIVISSLGGKSDANRGRPGRVKALHVLDLIERLEAERDMRAASVVRPFEIKGDEE